MATRTSVLLEDDLSGGAADETVGFAVDGKVFEIDLSAKNADKLRKVLAPYVNAGRRAGRIAVAGRKAPSQANGSAGEAAAMREWARANGYDVSSRGRIPAEIRDAYLSA